MNDTSAQVAVHPCREDFITELRGGGRPWSHRLAQLAALGQDWDGEREGAQPITQESLRVAESFIGRIVSVGVERPAVFPTEEGGISLEWVNHEQIESIEISGDGKTYELFRLDSGPLPAVDITTIDTELVFQFVQKVSAQIAR